MSIRTETIALVTTASLVGLGIFQIILGESISHSVSLIGNGFDCIGDGFVSGIVWVGLRFFRKPADQRFHFGYYKLENLASIAATIVMFLLAGYIILRSYNQLINASRRLSSIEINGTFYRTQKPESFRRWAAETPDDFVFSVKAPRYATNRPRLAEAGPSIERFFASGVTELGDKLGPVLWQLPPNKRFDAADLAAFLAAPAAAPRRPADAARARAAARQLPNRRGSSHCCAGAASPSCSPTRRSTPSIADLTADFVYARLQRAHGDRADGYAPADLDRWAERLRSGRPAASRTTCRA